MLSIYRLPNQIEGEKIVKVVRRDLFILFKKIIFSFLLFILPLGFFGITLLNYPNLFDNQIAYPFIVLLSSAYYLFIWLFFFFSFVDYYLDVWIITDERIIDVQQKGFFSRIIAEQRLYRIQDVTSEVHGFFPTILKYGEVHIQTAGAKQRFLFHEIPHPEDVRNMIIKLAERSKKKHEGRVNPAS
ncbi:PH domain-containing protein [Candidatus Parcubacteria bacterium]|nr:PH domain-containing protein [Candidatus Parcubacteria bacterium]